ncbi:TRAP transporter small permease [Anaerotignum sp.]|uniref:TRAP transporter small permease n=1 Tax=Anaerotignum sp. TaxID=2039241 RepID=UPI00289BF873|nr:TRAP transporter small permease [Anaerotignum sp.]
MKNKNKLSVLINLDVLIASVVLVTLIFLTFLGVVWRRVFGAPFTWLEEVQLACMVWIVFAAAGAAFRFGNHVAIEMIVDLMPEKIQKVFTVFISAVVVAVISYLFVQSIGFIQLFVSSGRTTPMLNIPYALIYGIAPVSYILMIFNYFYALIKGVKSEAKEAVESE